MPIGMFMTSTLHQVLLITLNIIFYVSSTNTTDRHDIAEILLTVALNTLNLT
jgi:hypothetical protein